MRRGADVHRTDKLRTPGAGMTWQARFAWRGRERQLQIRLLKLEPTQQISVGFDGPAVEGVLNIELVELSAKRTRMMMQVEIKPRTLPARRSASRSAAMVSASGFVSITELSVGPLRSTAAMRARYAAVSVREVSVPFVIRDCSSATLSSA